MLIARVVVATMLARMRSIRWLTATALVLLGCPSSPPEATTATSSATAAAEPVPSGLPIARLLVVPERTEGRYRTEASSLQQVIALATAGQLPVAKTSDGYRVLRADEGSVLALAGFRVDDELLRIANVPVTAPDLLVQLHPVWDQPQFQVVYRRGGQERSHTYVLLEPPAPVAARDAGEGGGKATPFDQEAFAQAVTRAADGTIEVKREAFDMLLDDQSAVMRSARVIPHKEGDRIVGLKLFGIRRGSSLEVLGFQNGDRVERVAGLDVSTPDRALEAYNKLRGVTKLDIVITRKGKPLTLRYRLVD